MRVRTILLVSLIAAMLAVGCAPAAGPSASTPTAEPGAKKRIVAAIWSDPPGIHMELTNPGGATGSQPGLPEIHQLLNAGLAYLDDDDILQPHLAEAVPSAENGLWKVLSDGRMETVWNLREGVAWHDGVPVTGADLAFTLRVNQDKEIGIVNHSTLELIESYEATGPRTIIVRWKAPFIEADFLFTPGVALPLPKHLLEESFTAEKERFMSVPFWRDAYVGTGPFKLKEWIPGSYLVLTANDAHVLGRPKLDEIEVRFVGEINALMASMLSGAVEKPLGRGLRPEHALQLKEQTDQIQVALGDQLGGILPIYPQFIDTRPPIVANVEFRRALLHAIDRQQMNETINHGLGAVADSWLQPDRPEYPRVSDRIVRYPYDPNRAAMITQALGYTRGADGKFVDSSGQRIQIELRATEGNPIQVQAAFPVADSWNRLGLDIETVIVPNQRLSDREYRQTFPAFEIVTTGTGGIRSNTMARVLSKNTPLPANNYTGGNRARYQNPVFDRMIERYITTIPMGERIAALSDILNHETTSLLYLPLFFQGSASVLGSVRLKNVTSAEVWNAHLWDV